ncbi:cardiolipin synthase [Elizabethkingia sp. JS20170427COW]|uniref:cardiolipin synthase n=1 Tax=Elizabethkingia sp. JS20170427COW TaxID=2583851 RepID=UPI00111065BD|nr:cardiolipin synthase [Elizabethkingia sp. JS20170427COW]QCX52625.1 cardiolipin synthase [Elizabethkingia sp. JS20170427COW]
MLGVIIRIIVDTDNPTKASAYILLCITLPILGCILYFAVGINYRKRKLYCKKLDIDQSQSDKAMRFITQYRSNSERILEKDFPEFSKLNTLFSHEPLDFATHNNSVKILINGEEKFSELLEDLNKAKHHIHIEYYIYENDHIGNLIANLLIKKAKEGVEVRFIYDDFGSRSIRKSIVPKLRKNGIKAYPFYKIAFINFANRINYRNHRKIIIIDGETCYLGGINISDKYHNTNNNRLYWRDTHLKVIGEAAWSLQNIFLADWNFCSHENIVPTTHYFKIHSKTSHPQWTQIINSGPDSEKPDILFSYIQAINSATSSIYITTPYFVPSTELLTAIELAIRRNIDVRILVPGISDSVIVNAVSKSHYAPLIQSGAKIYLYQKGFVHAKTMVCDGKIAFVGTANLDHRSFELNFEVNAIIYDQDIALDLEKNFLIDLEHSLMIEKDYWLSRPKTKQFFEKAMRLLSPLM